MSNQDSFHFWRENSNNWRVLCSTIVNRKRFVSECTFDINGLFWRSLLFCSIKINSRRPIVLEWLTHSKKVLTSKSSRFPNCQLPHRCLNSSDDVQFWFCHDVVVFFVYHTSVFLRCSNSSPIYQKIWKIHYKLFFFTFAILNHFLIYEENHHKLVDSRKWFSWFLVFFELSLFLKFFHFWWI